MSVEKLVKAARTRIEICKNASTFVISYDLVKTLADKLEELAAWNARLDRDLVDWTKKCFDAEAALAEKDKEIAALREALEQARIAMDGYGWKLDCVEKALARNAGGKNAE